MSQEGPEEESVFDRIERYKKVELASGIGSQMTSESAERVPGWERQYACSLDPEVDCVERHRRAVNRWFKDVLASFCPKFTAYEQGSIESRYRRTFGMALIYKWYAMRDQPGDPIPRKEITIRYGDVYLRETIPITHWEQ
jgi:hypothetical protein